MPGGMWVRFLCYGALMYVAAASEALHHYAIPGTVPSTKTGESEAVLAEMYVKVVRNETCNCSQYRGIAFFAPTEPRYHTW